MPNMTSQQSADELRVFRAFVDAAQLNIAPEIAPDGFWVEPELGGDALLRQTRAAEPQNLSDFDHRDLAIHPRLLAPKRGSEPETSIARPGERGERF
jgi:hypothetical protein